jgi:hypothetical protein
MKTFSIPSDFARKTTAVLEADEAEILRRIRLLAHLLDNRFVLPGTNYRIGLDAIIGLIPGLGDFATAGLASYIIYLASQLGVPRRLLARMALNVLVDMSAGLVPVFGDILDLAWKSNLKNLRLLEQHLHKKSSRQ